MLQIKKKASVKKHASAQGMGGAGEKSGVDLPTNIANGRAQFFTSASYCNGSGEIPDDCWGGGYTLRNTNATAGARKRIAVLVSGVQHNFILASKLQQIVPASRAEGYEVDFYIKLVAAPNGAVWMTSTYRNKTVEPLFQNVTQRKDAPKYVSTLQEAVRGAGAELRYFELLATEEKIELPGPEMQGKRMSEYDPFVSPVGRNVLRRYASIQELARLAVGQFPYSFVVVARDDDHFLGRLNVSRFTGWPSHADRVFVKECHAYGGMSDKTLVFGAAAANRTLLRLYSDFWMDDARLLKSNAEAFLKAFIELNGAVPTPVSLGDIPSTDSLWVVRDTGVSALCQKAVYLCYGPEDWPPPGVDWWQSLDRPDTCEDMRVLDYQ